MPSSSFRFFTSSPSRFAVGIPRSFCETIEGECLELFIGFFGRVNKNKERCSLSISYLLNLVGSREWLCLCEFERESKRETGGRQRVYDASKQSDRMANLAQCIPSSKYGNSWSSPQTAVIVLVLKRRFELRSNHFRSTFKGRGEKQMRELLKREE